MSTSEEDYEYRGLMATTWDLLRGDTSQWEDRFFYRKIIARYGQPVLDVGCGTGRLLLDYLQDGLDVDGVDNSPEMLALCAEKAGQMGLAPALFAQQMESLDLPRRYRTILVPSSSFQLVTSLESARRAIQHLHDHLEPGGALVMPFMLLWEPGDPTERDWKLLAQADRPEDGTTVHHWARDWFDVDAQLEHTENRYELWHGDKMIRSELHRRSPATRWYTQAQAGALYQQAGFVQIQFFKGFSDEPAAETDTLFSIVGERGHPGPTRQRSL